jgi:hypothetical protein
MGVNCCERSEFLFLGFDPASFWRRRRFFHGFWYWGYGGEAPVGASERSEGGADPRGGGLGGTRIRSRSGSASAPKDGSGKTGNGVRRRVHPLVYVLVPRESL